MLGILRSIHRVVDGICRGPMRVVRGLVSPVAWVLHRSIGLAAKVVKHTVRALNYLSQTPVGRIAMMVGASVLSAWLIKRWLAAKAGGLLGAASKALGPPANTGLLLAPNIVKPRTATDILMMPGGAGQRTWWLGLGDA